VKEQHYQRQDQCIDKQQKAGQAKAQFCHELKHSANQVEVIEQIHGAVVGDGR